MLKVEYRTVQELLHGRFANAWTETEAHQIIAELDEVTRASCDDFALYCRAIGGRRKPIAPPPFPGGIRSV